MDQEAPCPTGQMEPERTYYGIHSKVHGDRCHVFDTYDKPVTLLWRFLAL